jgi:hypothetical protein
MPPDINKVLAFLPDMDKQKTWEVIVGFSAFSFWAFMFYFVFFVMPGLANAEDVNSLMQAQTEERLMARHKDYCLAPQGSEQQTYYLRRRNELIDEYNDIDKNERFDRAKLASCEVLRPETATAAATRQ